MEIDAERLEASVKAADFMGKQFSAMSEMAKGKNWRIGDVPKDVSSYAFLKVFFDNQKEQFKRLYNEVDDKELLTNGLMKVCDLAISSLELDNANPYLKSELTSFQIKGWEDLRSFISFLA